MVVLTFTCTIMVFSSEQPPHPLSGLSPSVRPLWGLAGLALQEEKGFLVSGSSVPEHSALQLGREENNKQKRSQMYNSSLIKLVFFSGFLRLPERKKTEQHVRPAKSLAAQRYVKLQTGRQAGLRLRSNQVRNDFNKP